MVDEKNPPIRHVISFGPFRLIVAERLLENDGVPVRLSGRGLDLLIVLVEHAGEIVGKTDLIAGVWPDVTVDEGCLRFHISALRKALSDGQAGARYVATHSGRGYCFVAPISRSSMQVPDAHTLPACLPRMVGRDDIVRTISVELAARRFVAIVGPGGIGKTTVAIAVGHAMLTEFQHTVAFVDLGSVADPLLVPQVLASAIRLPVRPDNPVPDLVAFLHDKRMLLILDNCEHLIESVAALAERIFVEASQVHILATSRESLRVDGEHVHRMSPLACPPDDANLNAAETLAFPAAELFVERVVASINRFELNDAEAPIVAGICRKLDGIALAIELAAGRVEAYGIRGTAALLPDSFALFWQGRRTAAPRHRTLSAALDWSYDRLTGIERLVLCRLAIFAASFTLEEAETATADDGVERPLIVEAIANLVAKSLLSAEITGATMRYRLLHTTRTYARAKRVENNEAGIIVATAA